MNIKFYKENETGTIIASIDKLNEEKYQELIPNTTDAATEKHLPTYEIIDDKIKVKIGSISHPMETNHYIAFIALIVNNDIVKVDFTPKDKPEATFDYIKGSEIYAYCNKHDLWKINID